jgi:hypothetical protein
MGAALGALVFIAVVGGLLYMQFGAHTKRRYPRDRDDES